jgi:nicotinamidase-related amidase
MKMALLIIDLQQAYHKGQDAASMDMACEYINAVLPAFRAKGLPVILIRHVDKDDGAEVGSPGFELLEQLQPLPGETRIVKHYGNSFNRTGLAAVLAEAGVDTVVISGYCAEHCVLSTFRGAKDLDLLPLIFKGGIASGDAANLGFVEKICDVVSFRLLGKLLEN